MQLLESVIRVNEQQPAKTVELLRRHAPKLEGLRVAVLGLSFKPGTDDVRESPAFPIMRELLAQGAELKAFDPIANDEARKTFDDRRVTYCGDLQSAIADIDAVIVVTPWKEFQADARVAARPPAAGRLRGRTPSVRSKLLAEVRRYRPLELPSLRSLRAGRRPGALTPPTRRRSPTNRFCTPSRRSDASRSPSNACLVRRVTSWGRSR